VGGAGEMRGGHGGGRLPVGIGGVDRSRGPFIVVPARPANRLVGL